MEDQRLRSDWRISRREWTDRRETSECTAVVEIRGASREGALEQVLPPPLSVSAGPRSGSTLELLSRLKQATLGRA